jgi:uncharacterized membrane protein YfcA
MNASLDPTLFIILFLGATFAAALVAGLAGFAFGLVAAAVWLYILTPRQTATLIIALGLVVQGYAVWKLRHALAWNRIMPLVLGAALGVRSASRSSRPRIPSICGAASAWSWCSTVSTGCSGRR